MITQTELADSLNDYMDFALSFGANEEEGGKALLQYLGVDGDIVPWMKKNAPNQTASAGWLYGFSFALWYLNTKLNMVIEP
jgi:hypothetical protein